MQITMGKTCVELVQGDITEMCTDAIVNAANSQPLQVQPPDWAQNLPSWVQS